MLLCCRGTEGQFAGKTQVLTAVGPRQLQMHGELAKPAALVGKEAFAGT